ncbi:enoyl-CoA hydratase/isomerase family protein [Novosphingobium sp. FSY-8]|uniref:3-hydroxyisobutyryl-CoA hydrolase n=1 Tax=Novosphingobium ovatum TaxID=1908523 RepID=A0ABW9XHQ6_9SPHN|nr:enoyl-CoA hydratase/isomerase family protein [Novosphingobium ovatum]NBC38080.1 enoyl-CoA hydratase/isomerase family protein [Novosphingobium ovatum]
MTDDVIIRREGAAGILSLNRPKAIHALTHAMCDAMSDALSQWADDPAVQVVIVEHAEGRGFCSGGDINLLRQSALTDNGASGRAFFWSEYRLNHQMFTFEERSGGKPIVAFMDGITMGGGVGISQPARFRVATANTRYAMPETGIGLFPDVGGGWYLSRLKGHVGTFLAVTGGRIDGADCVWAGLSTHYLPTDALADAKARIAAGEDIATVLNALSETPPPSKLSAHADDIARHFGQPTLEAILSSLSADNGEWAQKELAALRTKSPQACKVSLREIHESLKNADFAAEMVMEYRIAARVLVLPDFAEGVRAVIVDKDNAPQWQPATPEGVTEAMVDAIFAPLPANEEWSPL